MLEQLLTTGGGWQDQYGGVLGGVKLLQSTKGFDRNPAVNWLPDTVFTDPGYSACHLLYYTGITRTAKDILAEIVRNMFLNEGKQLRLLRHMKAHTLEMFDAIQRCNFERMGRLIRDTGPVTWLLTAVPTRRQSRPSPAASTISVSATSSPEPVVEAISTWWQKIRKPPHASVRH